jgi:hypothetical protein
MKIFIFMMAMIIFCTGCGPTENLPDGTMTPQPATETEKPVTKKDTSTPSPSQLTTLQSPNLLTLEPIPITLELRRLIEIAVNDLADRISIEPDQVELIDITEETWQDTSLDCPQPGVMYTQIIDQGYSIILQGIDILYEYHIDSNNLVVYCRSGITLPGKVEGAVQDGWPNQPKDGDVIIVEPTEMD